MTKISDRDYIRCGVAVADGWSVNKQGQTVTSSGGYFGNIDDQEIRDALTAALVRQYLRKCTATVYTAWHSDSMKTIRFIIDSGVLL